MDGIIITCNQHYADKKNLLHMISVAWPVVISIVETLSTNREHDGMTARQARK